MTIVGQGCIHIVLFFKLENEAIVNAMQHEPEAARRRAIVLILFNHE